MLEDEVYEVLGIALRRELKPDQELAVRQLATPWGLRRLQQNSSESHCISDGLREGSDPFTYKDKNSADLDAQKDEEFSLEVQNAARSAAALLSAQNPAQADQCQLGYEACKTRAGGRTVSCVASFTICLVSCIARIDIKGMISVNAGSKAPE